MMPWLARPRKSGGLYAMNFTVIPRRRKPKPPIPLHRYVYHACRDIEHITQTALTCPPTDSWSASLLANILAGMRTGADELERAIELRGAEDGALHQERLVGLRQREAESKGGSHA
jgi:hypothetical protein